MKRIESAELIKLSLFILKLKKTIKKVLWDQISIDQLVFCFLKRKLLIFILKVSNFSFFI